MKRISFTKVVLLVLTITILGFGLTGCNGNLGLSISTTGTVKLVVSGTYYYDLIMDGVTQFSNKQPGTYTITNVPIGNRTFEAVDVGGSSYGYDIVTQYISTGENYVYLTPQSTATTGTVYLELYGEYEYNLKMDGFEYFSSKPAATYTITIVPVGNHTFEAINDWGAYWGYDSVTKYISAGPNYVYLYPDDY